MTKEMIPHPLLVKARLHLAHEENASLRTRIASLEAENERLRKALEASASALDEAMEDVSHWGSYAGEYFQNKHDLEGDLDRTAKQASAARRALEGGSRDA